MKHARKLVPLLLLAALLVPSVAKADPAPTKVQIAQNAQYVSPFQVDVQVTLDCTPGFGYFVQVSVQQPQGFNQVFGNGFTSGQCTGQQQKLAVSVNTFFFPGWQLGDAIASVIACAGPCDNDTKVIHITL